MELKCIKHNADTIFTTDFFFQLSFRNKSLKHIKLNKSPDLLPIKKLCILSAPRICFPCGSHNKQRLSTLTAVPVLSL